MFSKFFSKKTDATSTAAKLAAAPSVLGLRIGCSFELDSLMLSLLEGQLLMENSAVTHIIQAAGIVELDDTYIFRFYTDDDAFLQVVTQGGQQDEHVIDVKLFHYYDTLDVSSDSAWNKLLKQDIGKSTYHLQGYDYQRVWESIDEYHAPVHMKEKTYDDAGDHSLTDQFTMLYERPLIGADGTVSEDKSETLFLSAEEKENDHGSLDRCLVTSTGITLSSTQLRIHG